MRAADQTERTLGKNQPGDTDNIVLNLANADMVGHTGVYEATLAGCEIVDRGVDRLAIACLARGSLLAVTADHGNAEQMLQPGTQQPHTAHTMNLVPVLMVNAPARVGGLRDGRLSDIAPTVLELMGLALPDQMTGRSLIEAPPQAGGAEPAAAQ